MVCKINEWDPSLKSAWFSCWPTLIASCLSIVQSPNCLYLLSVKEALHYLKTQTSRRLYLRACIQISPVFISTSVFFCLFFSQVNFPSSLPTPPKKKTHKNKLSASHWKKYELKLLFARVRVCSHLCLFLPTCRGARLPRAATWRWRCLPRQKHADAHKLESPVQYRRKWDRRTGPAPGARSARRLCQSGRREQQGTEKRPNKGGNGWKGRRRRRGGRGGSGGYCSLPLLFPPCRKWLPPLSL